MPVAEFISKIGHDGSRIVWPELPEPNCRRSFHLQECIDCLIDLGYSLTEIERRPLLAGGMTIEPICPYDDPEGRYDKYFKNKTGIVFITTFSRKRHVFANCQGVLYDPATGLQAPKMSFFIDSYYLIGGKGCSTERIVGS
jgi:hypothetical protein